VKKLILPIGLAVVMLAACGKKDEDKTTPATTPPAGAQQTGPATPAQPAQPETTPSTTPTDQPAPAEQPQQ
jgi:hypothetical protein